MKTMLEVMEFLGTKEMVEIREETSDELIFKGRFEACTFGALYARYMVKMSVVNNEYLIVSNEYLIVCTPVVLKGRE